MRADIQPGSPFPDYELTDHSAQRRKLSELVGDAPTILVLSRGHFCPKDQWQHRKLVEFHPELKVGYARIVTISTSTVLETREWRDGLGASWTFLSDAARTVQKDLDIQEYTDPHHDPMIPHTLVLAPGMEVHSIYNGYWYWGRPTIDELRADLRAVTRRVRPDWDITRPELRAAWERGEKDRFFPYGKSYRQLLSE